MNIKLNNINCYSELYTYFLMYCFVFVFTAEEDDSPAGTYSCTRRFCCCCGAGGGGWGWVLKCHHPYPYPYTARTDTTSSQESHDWWGWCGRTTVPEGIKFSPNAWQNRCFNRFCRWWSAVLVRLGPVDSWYDVNHGWGSRAGFLCWLIQSCHVLCAKVISY